MRVKPMNKLLFFMGLSTFVVSGGYWWEPDLPHTTNHRLHSLL